MNQPITSKPSSNSPQNAQSDSDGKQSFQISAPSISLPKGGGAIRGMGEKFAANPVTGTGSMSVPIATSPGRSGFGPQLSLSYDSGAGNGPFGFGWSLSLPSITRKTDKGLPRYLDAVDSDVFILSGAEDLVPVLTKKGTNWEEEKIPPRTVDQRKYNIRRYRPRIEGLFARIERWTKTADPTDVFWRSISKDNITTWYGKDKNSRISDPSDSTHIFSWLICQTHDDKGNVIVYEYKSEDSQRIFEDQQGKFVARAHERNRTDGTRKANRYLKRIYYGNREPYLPEIKEDKPWPVPPKTGMSGGKPNWLFEVVLDYEDGHCPKETTDAEGRVLANVLYSPPDSAKWKARVDPFSTYRAGFEIRTYRLCQRVLMFHHFPDRNELGVPDYLVRSTEFTYSYEDDPKDARNPIYSFLNSVRQSGYVRQANDTYLKRSLPPLAFEYTQPVVQEAVHDVDPQSLENLPYGLDGARYQWVDLDGEGLSGILTEQGDAWFYKRNLSPLPVKTNGKEEVRAHFAPLDLVTKKPSLAALSVGGQQFLDLAGDGQLDLVALSGPTPGFFERTHDEDWQPFRTFRSLPNVDWSNPHLKFVDLTGDGHADILITEDEVFWWYPSLAEDGFGPAERVPQNWDEEKGPRLVFADAEHSIHLADLSGDGLSDLVRIRNGEVCYWPNLGYGRFGPKVTMDNAPWFDNVDQFDPRRIQLADIDGSGTTDIIYLGRTGIDLYFNQSGNGWSQPHPLEAYPQTENLSSITAMDLLGNGTACLVWSSPLPGNARRPMRYIDLMGGNKPHLLVNTVNNLGAETRVQYAPSTKFYVQDKLDGKPWITKIPFPVHVVERVETYDYISRNRFVTRYAYHHGYFDGVEREFRGFGMVEQLDTEQLAALVDSVIFPMGDNVSAQSHVPPVRTKTWFHTGVYLGRDHVSDFFAGLLNDAQQGEYFREPGLRYPDEVRALLLSDTELPLGLTLAEEREACRSLKGSMLRQEVYALDGSDKEPYPYTVTEQNFTIHALQPQAGSRHGVFFTHARESISFHYERNPTDPRIQHAMTLEVDAYGNALKEAAIAYGRRAKIRVVNEHGQAQQVSNPGLNGLTASDQSKQTTLLVTYTENRIADDRITHSLDTLDVHRNPLPCEARTFELTGYKPSGPGGRFQPTDLVEPDPNAPGRLRHIFSKEFAYEETAAGDNRRRLIEWLRTLYRKDDLTDLLPLGQLAPLSLPGESYKLAFTPGLLAQVFQRPHTGQQPGPLLPDPGAVLGGQAGNRGGYVQSQVLKADGRFPNSDADDHWWIPSGRSFFTTDPNDSAAAELTTAQQHFYLPRRYRNPFGEDATVSFDHDLLLVESRDALDNVVKVDTNDYRVLQPRLVSDPNRNRTEVAFDVLGMVAGTAVMGKPAPASVEGDSLTGFVADLTQAQIDGFHDADPRTVVAALLQNTTTRIVYDLDRFRRTQAANPGDKTKWLPPYAATLARETHASDSPPPQGLKIQISFSYSDGFSREIQKKIQAEPGPVVNGGPVVNPRWVGSGWTIFNNKGKRIRQYEPFFDDTHDFKFGNKVGVSPILFYDPIERVVATLHPNHTYDKVVFDPWQQTTHDVNDTVLNPDGSTDPRSDEHVKGFFSRLSDPDYLPTWYEQHVALPTNNPERIAANKAANHANTPTVAYFDTLGRPFLTVAHNKFERRRADGTIERGQGKYPTRMNLDIEGNQREVIDAKDRVVMRYDYDMLGNRIQQSSMEAGARWTLNDVVGKPIRAWDSRGFIRRMSYDELRRPTDLFVTDSGVERLAERTIYGEGQGDSKNHFTRVFQVFDAAGVLSNEEYDFKGNLRQGKRELLPNYRQAVDWQQNPTANDGTFITRTAYDALNRPVSVTMPDHSVYRPTFNEANLLDKVDVNLRGAAAAISFVTNIDYDAKGQRTFIRYANGAETIYEYDEKTFRLTQLKTTRPARLNGLASQLFADTTIVQDLHYSYDPVGNITSINDHAIPTIQYNNENVEPNVDYIYDAIYQLISAHGREHIGQTTFDFDPPDSAYRDYPFVGLRVSPNDPKAVRNYSEAYDYDEVGNIKEVRHSAKNSSWTRAYSYDETSLIENGTGGIPLKISNRLTKTTIGTATENYSTAGDGYDAHGNMLRMPQLPLMKWDYLDQLQATAQQVINNGTPERTWYVYDASGQRVRKVTESTVTGEDAANGRSPVRLKERIYLGGFEIYRSHSGADAGLVREALQIMDDKQRIALVETRTDTSALEQLIRYQFGNHLESTSLELDDKAEVISYEEYTSHGSSSYQAVRNQTETPKRYRYTGKEKDEESGLYYHAARYYSAWLSRWASCDPAGPEDGLNLYQYVRNQLINYVDKNGARCEIADWFGESRESSQRPETQNTNEDDNRKWETSEIDQAKSELKKSKLFGDLDKETQIVSSSLREEYDRGITKIEKNTNTEIERLEKELGHKLSEKEKEDATQSVLDKAEPLFIEDLTSPVERLRAKWSGVPNDTLNFRVKKFAEWKRSRVAKAHADTANNRTELYGKGKTETPKDLVHLLAHESSHHFDPEEKDTSGALADFDKSRLEIFAELFGQLILSEINNEKSFTVETLNYGRDKLEISKEVRRKINRLYRSDKDSREKAKAINELIKNRKIEAIGSGIGWRHTRWR